MALGVVNRGSCVALTWDAERRCRGVRARRSGTGVTVERVWAADATGNTPLRSVLADGVRALDWDESCALVAGPQAAPLLVTDLLLPPLDRTATGKALAFELARRVPLPPEHLVWAYRALPAGPQAGTSRPVRLVCFREADWQQLLGELSGPGFTLDAILPPAAALDPVLTGLPVLLPTCGQERFLFAPTATGAREWLPAGETAAPGFGVPGQPLAAPGLTLAPEVEALSAPDQQEYLGAVVLALYGLGRDLERDRETWFAVPRELRLKRNRAARVAVVLLLAWFVVALGTFTVRRYNAAATYLAALRTERERLQNTVAEYGQRQSRWGFLESIEKECQEARFDQPRLTACLLELTRRTAPAAYAQSFSWSDGRIELELRTTDDTLDFVSVLEASPLLSEVITQRKSVDAENRIAVRLQMLAAMEPGADGAALAPPLAPTAPVPPPPPPPPPPAASAEEEPAE